MFSSWVLRYFFTAFLFVCLSNANAELRTQYIFGDETVEDTVTRTLWWPYMQTNKNLDESRSFCGDFELGGVTGWGVPSESQITDFLTKYQTQATKPNGYYYNTFHWTHTQLSPPINGQINYKIVNLTSGGGVSTGNYIGASEKGGGLGVRCVKKLPNYTVNGIATAPVFLEDKISVSSFKQGIPTILKAYWKDLDDPIKYVKARYKKREAGSGFTLSGAWTTVDMVYGQGLTQFRAIYTSEITVNEVGTYDVQFLAASEDGSDITESAWSGSGLTFTVQKDGVTAPNFSSGNADSTGFYAGSDVGFTARWQDIDGDPYILNAKMRYKKSDATTWSSEYSMTFNTKDSDYSVFKGHLAQLDGNVR